MIKADAETDAGVLKSCQATKTTESDHRATESSGPGQVERPALAEGIDRNYAIKIKTMWCHFYGSFSMLTMLDGRTQGLGQGAGAAGKR